MEGGDRHFGMDIMQSASSGQGLPGKSSTARVRPGDDAPECFAHLDNFVKIHALQE